MVLQTDYLIIGAGIAGLSLAIGLEQRNIKYMIVDKMPKIQGIGAGIGITSNAIKALSYIHMDKAIIAIANPLVSLKICNQNGKELMEGNPNIISNYDLTNYAIDRGVLHSTLLQKISTDHILASKAVTTITPFHEGYEIQLDKDTTIRCKAIIGADGLHSVVRQYLFPNSVLRYSGYTCWRAIVDWKQEPLSSSMETWGPNGRFGITPLKNDKVYWYACVNTLGPRDKVFSNYTLDDLRKQFQHYHQYIQKALQATVSDQLIQNDISDLLPLKKYHSDHIVLIGDAAHATTPNLGQGACMGLEDVAVLLQEIDRHPNHTALAFQRFSERRVDRCSHLVRTAKRLGSIAQWENSFGIAFRNRLLPLMPKKMQAQQLKMILDTSFLEH